MRLNPPLVKLFETGPSVSLAEDAGEFCASPPLTGGLAVVYTGGPGDKGSSVLMATGACCVIQQAGLVTIPTARRVAMWARDSREPFILSFSE